MIDAKLNNYLRPYLIFLAKIIIKLNISANIITFLGFFFGLCCFYSIINFYFMGAFLFLVLNRFWSADWAAHWFLFGFNSMTFYFSSSIGESSNIHFLFFFARDYPTHPHLRPRVPHHVSSGSFHRSLDRSLGPVVGLHNLFDCSPVP